MICFRLRGRIISTSLLGSPTSLIYSSPIRQVTARMSCLAIPIRLGIAKISWTTPRISGSHSDSEAHVSFPHVILAGPCLGQKADTSHSRQLVQATRLAGPAHGTQLHLSTNRDGRLSLLDSNLTRGVLLAEATPPMRI